LCIQIRLTIATTVHQGSADHLLLIPARFECCCEKRSFLWDFSLNTRIFIKTLTGKVFELEVDIESTIGDVKATIEAMEGISIANLLTCRFTTR